MTYIKIAEKNVRKSIKDYTIYFFTLLIGVSVFYMFNSIESQSLMLELSETGHNLIKQMNEALEIISVFVAFILAFLIIYASRFLMKRRKKEFGIYMLLGMKKKKISAIILTETLIIGIISLGIGLLVGIMLSQLMSVIVANMFEANMTKFAFTFSLSALTKTVIYFTIIYVTALIFNVISVNKCKLIDLINSSRKSEKIKLKNMLLSIIVFIIAVVSLTYAYYNVTIRRKKFRHRSISINASNTRNYSEHFYSSGQFHGIILRIVKMTRKIYYKKVNSFIVKQISSQINTTVFASSIICLMLFMTICIVSISVSLKDAMNETIKNIPKVDISVSKTLDMNKDKKLIIGDEKDKIMAEESKNTVIETFEKHGIDVEKTFKNIISFNLYESEEIKYENLLGNTKEKALKENPALKYSLDEEQSMVKISDYNKFAEMTKYQKLELKDNEFIVISNGEYISNLVNEGLKTDISLHLNGKIYKPKYKETQKGSIEMDAEGNQNYIVIVMPDNALNENMRNTNKFYANYKNTNEAEMLQKTGEIRRNIVNFNVLTREHLTDRSIGFGAMIVFLGLYLGIVFLISSGAILALKQLSESTDNKERYKVLRKIGVDEKIINKALFKQIGIFFIFPLILAIIHSIAGIHVCIRMVESFGKGDILMSVSIVACFIVLIYGGYFLISYYTSKNIIT